METRIKEVRKAARLTQAEFGERIGIKANTVTCYEKGLRTPSSAIIYSIAKAFHVREEWLRTGEGEMYEQNAHTILDQLADEYRLGPAGRLIIQAALKMYDIGGERAFVEMIRELLPVMDEIIREAEGRKFNAGLAGQGEPQERSAAE